MRNTWETALLQAAVLTFEEVCFLCPETEHVTAPSSGTLENAATIEFRGAFCGGVCLRLSAGLLPVITANMLGELEAPADRQHDALGEVTNIICGNVLPQIAPTHDVFQLAPPQIIDAHAVITGMGTHVAGVSLALEDGWATLDLYVEYAVAANRKE